MNHYPEEGPLGRDWADELIDIDKVAEAILADMLKEQCIYCDTPTELTIGEHPVCFSCQH